MHKPLPLPHDHARVLALLSTEEWKHPTELAVKFKGYSCSAAHRAMARICKDLVRRGLAEQGGTKLRPAWRRNVITLAEPS